MENHTVVDQEFACEDCGFTSLLTNDVCPNCNGRMTALDAPIKKGGSEKDGDEDTATDAEDSFTESGDGGALSLERLQEEESRDDSQADDYGDGDE